LLLQGYRVTFLEQHPAVMEIRQHGLRLLFDKDPVHIPAPHLAASIEEALLSAPFDAGIFAIKSFDTLPALENIKPYLEALPPIICFQNGVENEAILASFLGPERVITGTITSAIGRRAAGDIVVERKRGLGLSSHHSHSVGFCHAFNDAGLNAHLYARHMDMKWSKMLTNLVGNATSAILDLTPAQIFNHPDLFNIEIQQLRETLAVMRAQGLQPINLPGVPVKLLALAAERMPGWIARPLLQRAVGRGRGSKMPSFHIDLHSGRGKSEVDYLNGAVVRIGQRVGVPTPVNQLLNQTLMDLTSGALSLDCFSHQADALIRMLPRD
jgi:2-dehydropantoate 2-reductase